MLPRNLLKFEGNKQCNDPISFIAMASRKLRATFLFIVGTFLRLLFTLHNVLGKGPVFPEQPDCLFPYGHYELCNRPYFPLYFVPKKSLASIGLGVSILLTAFNGFLFSLLLIFP